MDDDILILDRIAVGDREAFDDLVRKYQKPLYYMVYRMVSDHDDAADILQKTFVKAFTGIGGFERRSSFRTWLYQIAVNLVKNHYRDRSRAGQVPLDSVVLRTNPRTLDRIIRTETRDRMHAALATLPEKQRLTVLIRIQTQKTFEEIAGIMECTVGTAKANYHHGVRKLKALLAEQDADATASRPSGEAHAVQEE